MHTCAAVSRACCCTACCCTQALLAAAQLAAKAAAKTKKPAAIEDQGGAGRQGEAQGEGGGGVPDVPGTGRKEGQGARYLRTPASSVINR